MFGEEYSMTTFFPFPVELTPYSGLPEAVELVSSWIWLRMSLVSVGVRRVK